MKKQIIKNIFSNYFVNFLQMALGVLIVPFLIGKLGKDSFGLMVLAESTIGFFEVIAISVRIALSRHATFALAQGNNTEFIEYLSCGRYLLFICGALVFLLGATLSYFFPNIFYVPPELAFQSKILFLLITISFVITIPNIIYWSILYAKQRFDLINLSSSGGLILRAVAIFLLYSFLPKKYVNLITYGFIYLAMRFFQNYLIYIWHKKIMPGVVLSFKLLKFEKMRELVSFSGYTTLSSVSSMLYDNSSNILISIFYGPALTAVYAVSLKFPTLIKNLFLQATWSLTPTVTDLTAKNDTQRLEKMYFMYSKLISIMTIPICLFLIISSSQIINLWVGPDFWEAGKLLIIHMLPLIVTVPLAIITLANNAHGKVKIPSQVSFLGAICNVIMGIVLARVFKFGIYGFAISASLCTFLVSAVFMPYYSCKISNLSLKRYWLESFLKPFSLALVVFSFGVILNYFFFTNSKLSLLTLILKATLLSVVYYYFAFTRLLNEVEKETLFALFKFKSSQVRI